MTHSHDDWSPGPELLVAYFDGELAGRPDLEALCRRVQDWLRRHPEARAALADYRRLDRLWQETSPPIPGPTPGNGSKRDCIARYVLRLRSDAEPRRGVWTAALLATAASVALLLWLSLGDRSGPELAMPIGFWPAPLDDLEILPVAAVGEVAILHVAGADTTTLVVGELPVHGALELAGPGEVALTSVQPDARDNMVPHVRMGRSHCPMIWARVEKEDH